MKSKVVKIVFLVMLVRNVSGIDSTTETWVNDPDAQLRKCLRENRHNPNNTCQNLQLHQLRFVREMLPPNLVMPVSRKA